MNRNRHAKAHCRAKEEYILTTKLFCGHCKEMMVGYSGTSHTKKTYNYYICKNARKKSCDKKVVAKDLIENKVVEECLKLLDDKTIKHIAKRIAEECQKTEESIIAKDLRSKIKELDKAISNLFIALEKGDASDLILKRISERRCEKDDLEKQLAIEEAKRIILTEDEIIVFLRYISKESTKDLNKKRALINIFVHSVYLFDDHFNIILNGSERKISVDDIPVITRDDSINGSEDVISSTTDRLAPPYEY